MKRLVFVMLMFVGGYAHADCQESWLEHQSPTLYMSVEYSGGCYQGPLVIHYARFSRHDPKRRSPDFPILTVDFDRECRSGPKNEDGDVIEFSCRKDGVSPMAGATYRFRLVQTTIECEGIKSVDWSHTFFCVKGCGPATPRRLEVPFGEGCA